MPPSGDGHITREEPPIALDAAIHRQQHFDDDLASRVVDRLCFTAVHTMGFDVPGLCPPAD